VASLALARSENDDDYKRCEGVVKGWVDSSAGSENGGDKLSLRDLLFFLHIPRTGGRTYFHWYLCRAFTAACFTFQ
jgi:protein-tyrosine sulfotransferase